MIFVFKKTVFLKRKKKVKSKEPAAKSKACSSDFPPSKYKRSSSGSLNVWYRWKGLFAGFQTLARFWATGMVYS